MGWPRPEAAEDTSAIAAVSRSANGRASSTRCWAFRIRDAAISSIARVIFMVDWTDRIRRLIVRSFAPMAPRLPGKLGAALAGRARLLPELRLGRPPIHLQPLLLLLRERIRLRLL